MESLSAYARQFLERMEKPDVDSIDGLSPAVAIEQKNPTKTSRSTVGTATEIYDYLRLLWARVGHTFCPLCGREMQPGHRAVGRPTRCSRLPAGDARSTSPSRSCCRDEVTHEVVVENLRAQGFVRVGRRRRDHSTSTTAHGSDRRHVRQGTACRRRPARRRRRSARPPRRCGRHRVSRGRRRLRHPVSPSAVRQRSHRRPSDAASLHRTLRVRQRRHARPGADAAAVLVQQPARRVPALQRIRRDARVRRIAHRPLSRAHAARRRDRSVDEAALRQQAARARRVREARRHLDGHAVGAAAGDGARRSCSTRRARGFKGIFPFLERSRGEEVQAVHPRLPAAVSDGAGVPRLSRHQAAARSRFRCRVGGRDHRRR